MAQAPPRREPIAVRLARLGRSKVPSGNGPAGRGFPSASAPQSRRPAPITTNRRPPLSAKQPTTPPTRKERRASEREQDRFEAARGERKARAGTSSGKSGPSLINTRNMTIAAVVIGVLIVAFVAVGQLGGRAGGALKDPGIAYPASILDGNALGSTAAPVTLETYGDFQCPICAQNALNVEPVIVGKYVIPGQLRIVHHDIAILGNPNVPLSENESRIAAAGAVCSDKQGKYWDYSHWTFGNQGVENGGEFTRDRVTAIAKAAGVDTSSFGSCLDAADTLKAVDDITAKARGMNIDSTPTMFVNGQQLAPGYKSVEQLSAAIDAALAAASGTPVPSASPAASASKAP